MHTKDFEGWSKVKQKIHAVSHTPNFKEGEVWWCKIGVNVGDEIDGKNAFYNRPILILKKFNKRIFWGVALSTKIKEDKHYLPINIRGREQSVMLSHLRLYDSKRLQGRALIELLSKQFDKVKEAIKNLL